MPSSDETTDVLAIQVVQALQARVALVSSPALAAAVANLLSHARALHRILDTSDLRPGAQLIMSASPGVDLTTGGTRYTSLHRLIGALPPSREGLTIYIGGDQSYRVSYEAVSDDAVEGAVKYLIVPFIYESVIIPQGTFPIESPPGLISPFALTYFRDLDVALEDYYQLRAQKSECHFLSEAWGDPMRLALSNKPEQHLRRSLHDFLRIRLRDADPTIYQEQNVNETEPVDVRVQWLATRRISLLEVKWLGNSLSTDGLTLTTSYRDARALEGYTQVRDYMLEQRRTSPGVHVRSRVVVFDARRGALAISNSGTLESGDPWAYESREIDYSSVVDDDDGMDDPVRYFLEPGGSRAA